MQTLSRKFYKFALPIVLVIIQTILYGCSGNNPAEPAVATLRHDATSTTHYSGGLWDIRINLQNEQVEIIPLRQAMYHINVLPMLEIQPLTNLDIDLTNIKIHFPKGGNDGTIDADVILTHPLLNMKRFIGFDVKGIVIGADIENRDGRTRWWNPSEFLGGDFAGFSLGKLGTQDAGLFNETVNDYKYFCEGLNSQDDMSAPAVISTIIANRGHFYPGDSNRRRYELNFGPQMADFLVFQYAVDASWEQPTGNPPFTPESFPPNANQAEAWNITVTELENTLNYYGGSGTGGLTLQVAVYDWQGTGNTQVILKCDEAGVFSDVVSSTPTFSGSGYSVYQLNVPSATPLHAGTLPVTIMAVSTDATYDNGGPPSNPDDNVAMYFPTEIPVSENEPIQPCVPGDYLHIHNGIGNFWDLTGSDFWTFVLDITYLHGGPNDGYLLFPYKSGGLDTDPVTDLLSFDSDIAQSIPPQVTFNSVAAADQSVSLWSLDCDPVTGRVVWVGDAHPDTFIILDTSGTKLGELQVTGINNIIAVTAACFDKYGNLWALALRQTLGDPAWEIKCYSSLPGTPYYQEKKSTNLGPLTPFTTDSLIYDMDIDGQTARMFIFDRWGTADLSGSIKTFILDSAGNATYSDSLSHYDIFSAPVDFAEAGDSGDAVEKRDSVHHCCWGGDIVIDHSAGSLEHCRITTFAGLSNFDTLDAQWDLFDYELGILDEVHNTYIGNTFAINPDLNHNMVVMWRDSQWQHITPMAGW